MECKKRNGYKIYSQLNSKEVEKLHYLLDGKLIYHLELHNFEDKLLNENILKKFKEYDSLKSIEFYEKRSSVSKDLNFLQKLIDMNNIESLQIKSPNGKENQIYKSLKTKRLLSKIDLEITFSQDLFTCIENIFNTNPLTFLSLRNYKKNVKEESLIDLKMKINENNNLKYLCLSSKEIDFNDFDFIKNLKELEELKLEVNGIRIEVLLNNITSNTHRYLKSLDISFYYIEFNSLNFQNTSIVDFRFNCRQSSSKSLYYIVKSLEKHKYIRSLDFSFPILRALSTIDMSKLIANPYLKKLNLSSIELTEKELYMFLKGLEMNHSLESLKLNLNSIQNLNLKTKPNLKVLHINECTEFKNLIKDIQDKENLESLKLIGFDYDHETGKLLSKLIESNKNLNYLNIYSKEITEKAIESLFKSLESHKKITKFKFNYRIKNLDLISSLIENNESIESMVFSNINFLNQDFNRFCNSFGKNSKIKGFICQKCEIENVNIELLHQGLFFNNYITHFEFTDFFKSTLTERNFNFVHNVFKVDHKKRDISFYFK